MKRKGTSIALLSLALAMVLAISACSTTAQTTATAAQTTATAALTTATAGQTTTTTGSTSAATTGTTAKPANARTVANRAAALAGESITPKSFPKTFLPGIENVGAVPLKKYKIAISNGDMANEWRRSFWEDMMGFANQYKERFGVEIISANSGNNSTKQIQDIQALLSQQPDILLLSPNESGPLNAVIDMCKRAGVPLITLDRGLDDKPDGKTYIASCSFDFYLDGVTNGLSLVKKLTEKYGEPKGNVAEITGVLGSSPSIQRSQGMRRVLMNYPKIKIVTVRTGDFDRDTSFKAAQDILTVNPKGSLDAIVNSCDTSAIAALEAIKSAGRTELIGYTWGVDGLVEALEAIQAGEMVQTHECPPYLGMVAFEYAIHYLNGADIPQIIPIPQRDFSADTPEKKKALAEVIAQCKSLGSLFVPSSVGKYDIFVPDPAKLKDVYPKPWWEQSDAWNKEIEPYKEMK